MTGYRLSACSDLWEQEVGELLLESRREGWFPELRQCHEDGESGQI